MIKITIEVDWSKVDPQFEYVSMDADGAIWFSKDEPETRDDFWDPYAKTDDTYTEQARDNYVTNWEEIIVKRPS